MAERRMFAKSIVTSDAFLDMPMSARCLYFTLGMFADDDGFVNSPKSIMRQVGATNDDMGILLAKKFILAFEDGVIVIKHWRINNYLRSDRYQETNYAEHKAELKTDENGAYTIEQPKNELGTPVVYQADTQVSIGKESIYVSSKEDMSGDPTPHGVSTADIVEIVGYLNEKAGTSFRPGTAATQRHIKARLNEGWTVEDFKQVIDKKVAEWKGDNKMAAYLRPETLFGTKFEAYLQAPAAVRGGLANSTLDVDDAFEQAMKRSYNF